MEKAHRRAAREADGGGRRRLPLQRARRQGRRRRSELEAAHDAVLLAGGSEQPFDFFAKSPGRDLDGIHYAMTFLPQQNRRVAGEPAGAGAADHRQGQARHRHRRRRHGQRLHRHLVPPGRQVGDAARDHADAAREGEQGAVLAALAAEAARFLEPGRRRQGRVLDLHHRLCRQQRQGREAALHARRQVAEAGAGQRGRAAGRPGAVRHGLLRARSRAT